MSYHYIITASTRLRTDIPPAELAILEHFVTGKGARPEVIDDEDIERALQLGQLSQYNCPEPWGLSQLEKYVAPNGKLERLQLHVYAPGHKLEGLYEEGLAFLKWVARLAQRDGYIGSFICEDEQRDPPHLFFSVDGELFMSMDQAMTVGSVSGPQPRELKIGGRQK